jgi:hypothetical protein
MKRKMTLISIKHWCVCTGSKVSARMEITAIFCMKILKRGYLCVNTLKNKVSVIRVTSVCTNMSIPIWNNPMVKMDSL